MKVYKGIYSNTGENRWRDCVDECSKKTASNKTNPGKVGSDYGINFVDQYEMMGDGGYWKCRLEENRIIEIQDRFRKKTHCVEDWILPCIKA